MKGYDHKKTEAKWQKEWEEQGIYKAEDCSKKPKFYCLIEFPYPSGAGLHVGHLRSYSALDCIARKKRMQGFNVLYPIGWDAFGLPTENYAIKTGQHPKDVTRENIAIFKKQIKSAGISFDWSREINTTDPKYYKWTQWIFLKFFEKDLAYQDEIAINWCPKCKIGLANEEVVAGKCERCETETTKRMQKQWMLKITKYADRLLEDLKSVDYLDKIKIQQENWIGKSIGAEISFSGIKVFTTRADTIFGATFLVVSPDHKIAQKSKNPEVKKYINKTNQGRDKEKTGVFTGQYVINPANQEKIPIWVADYVLMEYGTGAIMAVPAHDERDREFAEKYNLKIKKTKLVNPEKIIKKLSAKKAVNYKLRDWIFSRQHYWGEPIPIIHCEKCGAVPVLEADLPVVLPNIEKYEPTDTGESPLAKIDDWVKVACPECGLNAQRETDTMPNWAGSSWYFLRFTDSGNNKAFADSKKLKYWTPVDLYNGGMEHTTLHLLYSRFWHKFLYDLKLVPTKEPYAVRRSHGMVLAEDGKKMSKSLNNVVNPDDVIEKYGADTLRLYEMFMGPFGEAIPWSTHGIIGVQRFLERVFVVATKAIADKLKDVKVNSRLIHKTIKKVSEDIENMKFNTAISQLMIQFNSTDWRDKLNSRGEWEGKLHGIDLSVLNKFLVLLAPFAPHITEELWHKLGNKTSIHLESWPKYDEKMIVEDEIELLVQVNGKLRDKIKVSVDISEDQACEQVMQSEKIKKHLQDQKIKKVIFVKGRLINFVI